MLLRPSFRTATCEAHPALEMQVGDTFRVWSHDAFDGEMIEPAFDILWQVKILRIVEEPRLVERRGALDIEAGSHPERATHCGIMRTITYGHVSAVEGRDISLDKTGRQVIVAIDRERLDGLARPENGTIIGYSEVTPITAD